MLRLMKFPIGTPQISNFLNLGNSILKRCQYKIFYRSQTTSVLDDIENKMLKLEQKVVVLGNLVENLKIVTDKMIVEKMINKHFISDEMNDEMIDDKKISDKVFSDFKKVFSDQMVVNENIDDKIIIDQSVKDKTLNNHVTCRYCGWYI